MNRIFALPLVTGLTMGAIAIGTHFPSSVVVGNPKPTAYNRPLVCQHCLYLRPTNRTNALGNPIYRLEIYENSRLVQGFDAVAGRAFTQGRNRHVSGTEAPPPDGKYSVSSYSVPGTIVEAGQRFIPITPQFRTGRSALGIHYDPSFNRRNGEDGTSGCIGLTNLTDFETLRHYIEQKKPSLLYIKIL